MIESGNLFFFFMLLWYLERSSGVWYWAYHRWLFGILSLATLSVWYRICVCIRRMLLFTISSWCKTCGQYELQKCLFLTVCELSWRVDCSWFNNGVLLILFAILWWKYDKAEPIVRLTSEVSNLVYFLVYYILHSCCNLVVLLVRYQIIYRTVHSTNDESEIIPNLSLPLRMFRTARLLILWQSLE